jgi:hypothetical protein
VVLGFELRALARQVLYNLIHALNPFFLQLIFPQGLVFFAQINLGYMGVNPPDLHLL